MRIEVKRPRENLLPLWEKVPAKRADERLCWQSSVLPWGFVSEDCVEDGEELSRDGDCGTILGFPLAMRC